MQDNKLLYVKTFVELLWSISNNLGNTKITKHSKQDFSTNQNYSVIYLESAALSLGKSI